MALLFRVSNDPVIRLESLVDYLQAQNCDTEKDHSTENIYASYCEFANPKQSNAALLGASMAAITAEPIATNHTYINDMELE